MQNDVKLETGKDIKHIRVIELDKTLEEFVDLYNKSEPLDLQISRSTLSRYERGEGAAIRVDEYEKIKSLVD